MEQADTSFPKPLPDVTSPTPARPWPVTSEGSKPATFGVSGNTNAMAPYIAINLAGVRIPALFDTGATVSVVGDYIKERYTKTCRTLQNISSTLRMASDVQHPTKSAIRLTVQANKQKIKQRFLYIPGITCHAILGRDFLAKTGIVLDLKAGHYHYGAGTPSIRFIVPAAEVAGNTVVEGASWVVRPKSDFTVALVSLTGSTKQKEKLTPALRPFAAIFTETPGRVNVLEYHIDTGDARPVRFNARQLSTHKRPLLDVALDERIETKTVRPSKIPCAFPILLVQKKGGTPRLCVDYRRLNAMSVRDSYPFPSIDAVMYSLGPAKVFTILDCSG